MQGAADCQRLGGPARNGVRLLFLLLLEVPRPLQAEWEAPLLTGASASVQPQGQLHLPFFWPLNTQRKHVKVQSVYTESELRAAGVPVGTPITGLGLMVGQGENYGGTTINGLRVAFRWMTDGDLAEGLTVWGTSRTTFRFVASGGVLLQDYTLSPQDLVAGARQCLRFSSTELIWDGQSSLMLEVSMVNDQANVLSTALPAFRLSPTTYPCSLGQRGATAYACTRFAFRHYHKLKPL